MKRIEKWIADISWHPNAQDNVKASVAANVRAFARVFRPIIAAEERERCAKIVLDCPYDSPLEEIAAAIRSPDRNPYTQQDRLDDDA